MRLTKFLAWSLACILTFGVYVAAIRFERAMPRVFAAEKALLEARRQHEEDVAILMLEVETLRQELEAARVDDVLDSLKNTNIRLDELTQRPRAAP